MPTKDKAEQPELLPDSGATAATADPPPEKTSTAVEPVATQVVEIEGEAPPQEVSPLELLRSLSLNPDMDPEKLAAVAGEILKMKRDWEADEARKLFTASLVAFQSECPIIAPLDKGAKNVYAKLDRIHRETRPIRDKHGLSVTWTSCTLTDDGAMCQLRGFLVHRDGHSIDVAYDVPVPEAIKSRDGGLVTNAAQRMVSATTYGKRAGECAVLGIVTGQDDDGAGAGPTETITPDQAIDLEQMLQDSGKNAARFFKWAGCESMDALPEDKRTEATSLLDRAIKEREAANAEDDTEGLP